MASPPDTPRMITSIRPSEIEDTELAYLSAPASAIWAVSGRAESICAPRTAMAPCELSPSVTAADPAW
jgi:hypothetical protein